METLHHEHATRDIWVCEAGAFTVLKALAFEGRGENKDAYDLHYVIRAYCAGVEDVAAKLRPIASSPDAKKALAILRRDFLDVDGVGPRRVADFVRGAPDDEVQADVVAFVEQLLVRLG